jgi:hypothetical protein
VVGLVAGGAALQLAGDLCATDRGAGVTVNFTIDSGEISTLAKNLAVGLGRFESIAARAMTTGAIKAREAIRREIEPNVKGGPTAWTKRGLIVRYARKDDLRAMVGYQYGDGNWEDDAFTPKGGGVPAGRYMGLNARGGDRRPKGAEMQLRRAGVIGKDQFITPGPGVRLNRHGNVSGGQYQQMLSRLRALTVEGSNQNAVRGGPRRSVDYFVMRRDERGYTRGQLGAEPAFIAKRRGRGGRGFVPAFWITDQPNYERRFPIQSVAMREFQRVFPAEFERILWKGLAK